MNEEKVGFVFMPTFSSPGETRQTVEETLNRIPFLKSPIFDFSIGWRIQPRTALRERAIAEGLIPADDDCWEGPILRFSRHIEGMAGKEAPIL